jgi:predicted transcriptional regulator
MKETHAVRLPDSLSDKVEELANEHDTTESEVMRHLLDNGLRAHKYYDGFEIDP